MSVATAPNPEIKHKATSIEDELPTMSLTEAIDFLNGREHTTELLSAETFFLKRLMENLDLEEKAECYYYLLRCRLRKSKLFETVDALELYSKMRDSFFKAEQERIVEARSRTSSIAKAQLKAFYRLTIFYFGSLENLYQSLNFDESARQAYQDKMDLKRRSYLVERKWIKYAGYTLVDITSRYGNSFLRWGATTMLSILAFAGIYANIDAATEPAQRLVPDGASFFDYFYFTIVTFTTLGYGDLHPITVPHMIAASLEVLIGYFMLGVFINLMNRRL